MYMQSVMIVGCPQQHGTSAKKPRCPHKINAHVYVGRRVRFKHRFEIRYRSVKDAAAHRVMLAQPYAAVFPSRCAIRRQATMQDCSSVLACLAVPPGQRDDLVEAWRRYYNAVRHSSLGYRPPAPEAILPPASRLLRLGQIRCWPNTAGS
jgi:hypothetical protein